MFIRSVELFNIRSYHSQKIEFDKGITLLSGDIGSGKTSILIAIEFALFGILRGKTSVHELLSHGADEGYVILNCEIQGKDVTIKRSLKRSQLSVNQKEGSISVNGQEETLTPTELKARVLTLLGYPESLLNKSTNLFRYTVYTPQEQVKLILHESPEERKDVIRKIFDIDKYKRVGENTNFYLSDVKERVQRLKGQTDDVKILQEQFSAQKIELERLEMLLPKAQRGLEIAKQSRELLEREQMKVDMIVKAYQQEENKLKLLEQSVKNKEELVALIEKQIIEKNEFLKNFSEKELVLDISKKEKLALAFDKIKQNRSIINQRKGALESDQKRSLQLVNTISSLENCPTCKQDVGSDHKDHMQKEQQLIIDTIGKKKIELEELGLKLSEKEKELDAKKLIIDKEERDYLLFKQQKVQFVKSKQDLEQLEKKKETELSSLGKIQIELLSHKQVLDRDRPIIDFNLMKKLADAKQSERLKDREFTELSTKLDVSKKMSLVIREALVKKTEIAKRIDELSGVKDWLSELFLPLVKTIEKRVLLKVYHEFNDYFMQWFAMLIEDDAFTVRLNEDFTPLIEQNGFDTSVANLSGGEKTALALAYRLALNKVLNTYFGSLHTKDILILDEPTDGFSTEQIDRLRDVFDQLELSQLILVSHEHKLESLSQNIIRVEKQNQISILK